MKQYRSVSQILFGFLPEQTVDLEGKIWKVKEWRHPRRINVDTTRLRRELIRQAKPWEAAKYDGYYVRDLLKGHTVRVVGLQREDGVTVESFPQIWKCQTCNRISDTPLKTCRCGSRKFGQLPFVAFHDECGAIRQPYIPRCPEHNDVQVVQPGTSQAAELKFVCPSCKKLLREGLGFAKCSCGKGTLSVNVHRSSTVYTPRTFVLVNLPSQDQQQRPRQSDWPARALSWVLTGLSGDSIETSSTTRTQFRQMLTASGLTEDLIEQAVSQAVLAGKVVEDPGTLDLAPGQREEAEDQAVTIAIALEQSRMRVEHLQASVPNDSPRAPLYRDSYPSALRMANLESIELVDRFPILTGSFGYTRGKPGAGASRLVPFSIGSDYVVYADIAETEALFVRLQPSRVASWLSSRGFDLGSWHDDPSARVAILRGVDLPSPGDSPNPSSAGSHLLSLLHTYSHRFIRTVSVRAGIDRNALSELLVPLHCGFFVYAASRGDFVLGGLQAIFETELDRVLRELIHGDHRCVLDPGCQRGGGACVACLHLGEPSCRYFNSFLDRSLLFGPTGYLRAPNKTW